MKVPFLWMIAIPLLASPAIYLIGRLSQILRQKAPVGAGYAGQSSPSKWAALLVLAINWIPFYLSARQLASGENLEQNIGSIPLNLDGIGLLLAAVALGLGSLVVLFSVPYMAGETGEEKYYSMLVALVGVMIGLGFAGDLFNLWIWFEGLAVSSYLLVVFYREQPASLEAGIKYVVQSATGSILVLLGISLVLAQTGTLRLDEIHNKIGSSPAVLAAGALFVVGFGVKAALVPLHTWLPDAHSQAPSGISAMLSGVVIEAGLVAMIRALAALSGTAEHGYPAATWGSLLMAFGVLNMLVGNLMALRQTQVKRLLAYSSLSHIGYMVLGLGIAFFAGQPAGAQGSLFHLINHSIMKGLAFLAAGAFLYAITRAKPGETDGQDKPVDHGPLLISDLDGAAQRYPVATLAFSLALLGLAGLPPLSGFMSKWQIFAAGFAVHNLAAALLVVFAALNSVLSLAYYAPLVNAVYRKKPSLAVQQGSQIPTLMNLPLVLLAIAVVILGFWPGLVQWLTAPASQILLVSMGSQ